MLEPKAVEDFRASRNILAASIGLFNTGHRDLYRIVAVELRKLLCDGRSSLLPRLVPSPGLHPLLWRLPASLLRDAIFMTPATVTFDGQGKSNIVALFDRAAPMIPLEAWLDQPLFSAHITIRVLIRSVADKEAAHADRSYNEALILSRSVKLVDEDIHKQHIVAIGEYVLELMTNTINRYPDVFK